MEDIKLQKEEVVDAKLVSYSELLNMWDEGVIVPKSRFLLYKDKIKEFIQSPS
jgi:small nuclear ribonucleoprotein (snRNP)-like protein